MNCSQVRKILYPSPERAVLSIDTADATSHLRECGDCRAYFASQADWSSALQQKLQFEPAPAALRDRIGGLVQKHRSSRIRLPFAGKIMKTAAAAAVVVVGLASWWLYHVPSQHFFEEVCNDHAKYLDAQSQLPSSDPASIENWFRDKAEVGVHVPKLENADLLGSRLCSLKQHKAALIFYRKQGRPVSLFQFNSSGVSLAALDRSVIDGEPIWHKSFNGYSLVAFESRGVITVLVSDLQEGELLPLALAARRG